MPSPVGGLGLAPRKKYQFCAKNYAILSKFWYLFPILQHAKIVTSALEKVGGPIPLSPLLRCLCVPSQIHKQLDVVVYFLSLPSSCCTSVICPLHWNAAIGGNPGDWSGTAASVRNEYRSPLLAASCMLVRFQTYILYSFGKFSK